MRKAIIVLAMLLLCAPAAFAGSISVQIGHASWYNFHLDSAWQASSPPMTWNYAAPSGAHTVDVAGGNDSEKASLAGTFDGSGDLSGSGTLSVSGCPNAQWYNLYLDGSWVASLSGSGGSQSVSPPAGSHTLAAIGLSGSSGDVCWFNFAIVEASAAPAPTPSATPTPSSEVSITSPANGAVVSGTVAVTAQVASNVSWVNFYLDGGYHGSSPPYSWSWDTSGLNGSHTISAKAYASNDTLLGTASVTVNVGGASSGVTAGATISSLTGSPSGLQGNPDTNVADYGKYPVVGDGMGLIGGPLLDDATAESKVVAAPESAWENGNEGATAATDNANENNYFNSEASNNQSDYLNQIASFRSQWPSGAWGGAVARIDGACPMAHPTTAEVIQFAANKWGINLLLMYAEADYEGHFNQDSIGDNGTSSGLFQVADRNYPSHAFPGFQGTSQNLARESSCFNADFFAAHLWAAYHGYTSECPAGDIGTAIETWYEGTASAPGNYTAGVYYDLSNQLWLRFFGGQSVPY